jgi:hypothetical protein
MDHGIALPAASPSLVFYYKFVDNCHLKCNHGSEVLARAHGGAGARDPAKQLPVNG